MYKKPTVYLGNLQFLMEAANPTLDDLQAEIGIAIVLALPGVYNHPSA